MKTKSDLRRQLLARLLMVIRWARLAECSLMLSGFSLPVSGEQVGICLRNAARSL